MLNATEVGTQSEFDEELIQIASQGFDHSSAISFRSVLKLQYRCFVNTHQIDSGFVSEIQRLLKCDGVRRQVVELVSLSNQPREVSMVNAANLLIQAAHVQTRLRSSCKKPSGC
jgi:hypothetical protein